MKPLIAVKDNEGNVYTMPSNTSKCIIEIHYSTSYYQFIVQDVVIGEGGEKSYPEKSIIVPIDGGSWIDLLSVEESELSEVFFSEGNHKLECYQCGEVFRVNTETRYVYEIEELEK